MQRRHILVGFAGAVLSGAATEAAQADEQRFLMPTRYIDSDSGPIRDVAARLAPPDAPARTKGLAAFAFVRDEVRFGFGSSFYDYSASQVLSSRIGYCNTKGTLFAALLRAMGVPARQVFVDIDAGILRGIIDPGTPFVDHSYVEAFLGGRWIATDAYIVDPALFRGAARRLAAEGQMLGYGLHNDGTVNWDARRGSFSQFVDNGAVRLTSRRFGVFDDVGDFYIRAPNPWNRLGVVGRAAFGLGAGEA
ncbi:MAG: transglutaminase-like domain-containing protein, partial [Bosea sp. (in: a-proteobacteria)]